VQGGFISPLIDTDSAGTSVEMSPELTSVRMMMMMMMMMMTRWGEGRWMMMASWTSWW
jgi:hypothetical protein